MEEQNPHVGWTLSHLVLRARQRRQAFSERLRGYLSSDAGGSCWRRFRELLSACLLTAGGLAAAGDAGVAGSSLWFSSPASEPTTLPAAAGGIAAYVVNDVDVVRRLRWYLERPDVHRDRTTPFWTIKTWDEAVREECSALYHGPRRGDSRDMGYISWTEVGKLRRASPSICYHHALGF